MPVIRVEKATKQYNEEGRTLYAVRELSLTVEQGDFVFLIGSSGAGKSTLVLLLMRLVEPTEGRVMFGGTDIRKFGEDEYRRLFSTVFQDFKMFSFTIQDNITALGEANPQGVEEAL